MLIFLSLETSISFLCYISKKFSKHHKNQSKADFKIKYELLNLGEVIVKTPEAFNSMIKAPHKREKQIKAFYVNAFA